MSLLVPAFDYFLRDPGKRVVAHDVVRIQGVFFGLRDFCVGVHVCPFFWGVSWKVFGGFGLVWNWMRVWRFFRGQW